MSKKYLSQQELRGDLLDMLSVIDDYCKKNSLRYSLGGGTYLGAIRHKGFIPWDDDIDLMMPRKDYNYLRKHFNDYHPFFKVTYAEKTTVIDNTTSHLKIHDKRTQIYEGACDYNKTGVFIDIFPIDGVPSNKKLCKTYITFCIIFSHLLLYKNRPWTLSRQPEFLLMKCLGCFFSYKTSGWLIDKLISAFPFEKCEYSATILGRYGLIEVYPKVVYDNYSEAEFEGKQFSILKDYDTYLGQHYGDYMKLPPEKDRINHQIKAWWLE